MKKHDLHLSLFPPAAGSVLASPPWPKGRVQLSSGVIAAPPYTEAVDADEYLRVLFVTCDGPLTVTEIKIGS